MVSTIYEMDHCQNASVSDLNVFVPLLLIYALT